MEYFTASDLMLLFDSCQCFSVQVLHTSELGIMRCFKDIPLVDDGVDDMLRC